MTCLQVLREVPKGLQLSPPKNCPEPIQKLMVQCWKTEPRDRWRFRQIVQFLNAQQCDNMVPTEILTNSE